MLGSLGRLDSSPRWRTGLFQAFKAATASEFALIVLAPPVGTNIYVTRIMNFPVSSDGDVIFSVLNSFAIQAGEASLPVVGYGGTISTVVSAGETNDATSKVATSGAYEIQKNSDAGPSRYQPIPSVPLFCPGGEFFTIQGRQAASALLINVEFIELGP